MGIIMSVPEAFLKKQGVKNPKLVIYGSMAVIAGIVVFLVIRRIKINRGGRTTSGSTQNEMEKELGTINTGNTTLSSGEATMIAQNLLNAMDRWGTDEQAIIDNLSRAKTAGDLNLIIQKFGIKPKASYSLADTFIERTVEGVMKNLNGWLRHELSGSDLRKVKEIYDRLGVPF